MIRYLYNQQFTPPAPFVHVRLRYPPAGTELEMLPALLDSAADRTTIPGAVVGRLGMVQIAEATVSVFGGNGSSSDLPG